MNVVDFYNKLLPLEAGEKVAKQDEQMANDMKEFLMMEFGTTKVSQVNKDALKAKLEGPALIERIAHRKAVAMAKQKEVVAEELEHMSTGSSRNLGHSLQSHRQARENDSILPLKPNNRPTKDSECIHAETGGIMLTMFSTLLARRDSSSKGRQRIQVFVRRSGSA